MASPFAGLVALALVIVLHTVTGSWAFSCGGPPSLQQRQLPLSRGGIREAEAASALVVGTAPVASAAKGAALGIFGAVALLVGGQPKRVYRRAWRKLVRSRHAGRKRMRRDEKPPMLGPTEVKPLDKKKIFHYYCNKIYKVIRESSASSLDMPPASTDQELSSLDPQKSVVRPLNEAVEQFVSPAVWNQPIFRAIALVSGGALAGGVLPFSAMLHLSSYGIWLGTNVWTTFIAGLTMFKNLPRKQFGSLQAKLFPKYFQLGTACTSLVLLTGHRLGLPSGPALASLIFTLVNLLYLSPKSTEVMFERYERDNSGIKDPAIDKKLKAEFSKLHGMSSLANLLALIGLIVHGVVLAQRI